MIEWLDIMITQAAEAANIEDFDNYTAIRVMWIDRIEAVV